MKPIWYISCRILSFVFLTTLLLPGVAFSHEAVPSDGTNATSEAPPAGTNVANGTKPSEGNPKPEDIKPLAV